MNNLEIPQCILILTVIGINWFCHILRMPDSRDVKRVYDWKPDKKRPIGRPRKRFRDQIKEITSREIDDFSVVEAMTQDRSEWRSFIQRLTTNR